jgi:hypothetical protein
MPSVLKTSWAHFNSYRLPQGRRVYSNPLPKTASRRRHPPEPQRGMQRPFRLRLRPSSASGLQSGLRRTGRLDGGHRLLRFTFHLSPSSRAQSRDSRIYSRPFAVLFRKNPTGCAKTRERSRSRTICCGRDNSRFSLPHHSDTRPLLLGSSLGSHDHAITLVEPFAGPEYLSAVGFSPGT